MSIERVDYNGKIDWNVFLSTAAGPTECYSCLENDPATCSANQRVQTCATDRGSVGTTHRGFGAGIYRDKFGNTNYGVMRGCINCAGDKFENCLIVKHSYQIKFKYVKGTAVDCQTVDTYPTWLYLISSLYFIFTWFNLDFFFHNYMKSFFYFFFYLIIMNNIINFTDLLIQINTKRVRGLLAILKHC